MQQFVVVVACDLYFASLQNNTISKKNNCNYLSVLDAKSRELAVNTQFLGCVVVATEQNKNLRYHFHFQCQG